MIKEMIFGSFLGITSYEDWKSKEVSVFWMIIFGVIGGGCFVWSKEKDWIGLLFGAALGVAVWGVCFLLHQKIGLGDIGIIEISSLYLGGSKTLDLLMGGLAAASIYGLFLLIVKRKSREQEIPFIPFLLLSFIRMFLWEKIMG